jgi:integrase
VKKPKFDNRRVRHLSAEQAAALLEKVRKRSEKTHAICVIALYSGARAGEIFSLTWADVDLSRGILTLRDTKSNGLTRRAFITERMREVLEPMKRGKPDELVFPDRKGKKADQVSYAFNRAVADLQLNDGVTDRRQRVCFHTLRHSFASWLVERGTDLYQVKELMGHSTIALTERYAHLRPHTLQAAVKVLDEPPEKTHA